MEIKVKSNFLKQSPKKMRKVVDLVRGKNVVEALNILKFINKKAAMFIEKTIRSGIASVINQESNKDEDNLYIKVISVDGGPMSKRWKPAAYGRATPRLKRTSHLTIILSNIKN